MNNVPPKPAPLYSRFSEVRRLMEWMEKNNIPFEEQNVFFPSMLTVKIPTGVLNSQGKMEYAKFSQVERNAGEDGPISFILPGEISGSPVSLAEAKVLAEQYSGKLPIPQDLKDKKYEQALDLNISLVAEINRATTQLTNLCARMIGTGLGSTPEPYVLAENGGFAILYDSVANVLLAGMPDGVGILSPRSPVECFKLFGLAKQNVEKGKMKYVSGSRKSIRPSVSKIEEANGILTEINSAINESRTLEDNKAEEKNENPKDYMDKRKTENPQLVLPFSVANGNPEGRSKSGHSRSEHK